MLSLIGDSASLIQVANQTDSLLDLMRRLQYLNTYGEDWKSEVNVTAEIFSVHTEKKEVDVRVNWIAEGTWGGLNLERTNINGGWTWTVRQ